MLMRGSPPRSAVGPRRSNPPSAAGAVRDAAVVQRDPLGDRLQALVDVRDRNPAADVELELVRPVADRDDRVAGAVSGGALQRRLDHPVG